MLENEALTWVDSDTSKTGNISSGSSGIAVGSVVMVLGVVAAVALGSVAMAF